MKDKMISISDKILTVVVVSIMMIGMLSIAVRMGTRILEKKGWYNEQFVKLVFFDNPIMADLELANGIGTINWKELYPFEDKMNEYYVIPQSSKLNKGKTINLKITKIQNIVKTIEKWINEQFIARNFWIENEKKIENLFGVNIFSSAHKLPNGHFSTFTKRRDIKQKATALIKLNDFLQTLDTPFLYVQAPFKIDPNDKTISGKSDFSNQNTDEFLSGIQDAGIDFIDMRDEIKKAGLNHYDCFYKTDHHWKSETGLWATKIIAETLNEKFSLGIDEKIFDFENYNFEILKDSFLGSHGRAVTLANADMEDFTLITPKNNYSLEAEFYSETNVLRKATGGFDVLLFPENIQTKETVYTRGTYGIYMDGDTSARIKNNSSENNLRILFLGDSFTDVVEPFFALGVKEFDTLDLRHFKGSLTSWLEQNGKYDAVIMLVNAESTVGEIDYTTHTDLWDFR